MIGYRARSTAPRPRQARRQKRTHRPGRLRHRLRRAPMQHSREAHPYAVRRHADTVPHHRLRSAVSDAHPGGATATPDYPVCLVTLTVTFTYTPSTPTPCPSEGCYVPCPTATPITPGPTNTPGGPTKTPTLTATPTPTACLATHTPPPAVGGVALDSGLALSDEGGGDEVVLLWAFATAFAFLGGAWYAHRRRPSQ